MIGLPSVDSGKGGLEKGGEIQMPEYISISIYPVRTLQTPSDSVTIFVPSTATKDFSFLNPLRFMRSLGNNSGHIIDTVETFSTSDPPHLNELRRCVTNPVLTIPGPVRVLN